MAFSKQSLGQLTSTLIFYSFKNIPTVGSKQYTFDWNPCTSFSENSECLNMLVSY